MDIYQCAYQQTIKHRNANYLSLSTTLSSVDRAKVFQPVFAICEQYGIVINTAYDHIAGNGDDAKYLLQTSLKNDEQRPKAVGATIGVLAMEPSGNMSAGMAGHCTLNGMKQIKVDDELHIYGRENDQSETVQWFYGTIDDPDSVKQAAIYDKWISMYKIKKPGFNYLACNAAMHFSDERGQKNIISGLISLASEEPSVQVFKGRDRPIKGAEATTFGMKLDETALFVEQCGVKVVYAEYQENFSKKTGAVHMYPTIISVKL